MTARVQRLAAWARGEWLLIATTVAAVAFVAVVAVFASRLYEERQARLDAIADQARTNREINHDLCSGLNEANGSVRFILDTALRLRPPDAPPIRDPQRQAYIDAYHQLPERNCATGEKTFYDPPFPPERTP